MTVIVERAIIAVVRIEAESREAAQAAFADLETRVQHSLPKLRFGDVRVVRRIVVRRQVSDRGLIRDVPR